MTEGTHRPPAERLRITTAFASIGLVGVVAGGTGVLLPAQMADFGVDKTTIGLMFFAFSGGYVVTASANGALLHWLGVRWHLMAGTAGALVAAAALTLPGPFPILLVLQVVLGAGLGTLDAGLNSYLSTLHRSTALLNYFHAFFGVGALLGPVLAAVMLDHDLSWRSFYGGFAVGLAALLTAFWFYPRSEMATVGLPPTELSSAGLASPDLARPASAELTPRRGLGAAVRLRVVLVLAAFLAVYVGIESAVGNWTFSFLTEERGQDLLTAGWVVSGYWLGLTLGRFILNASAERVGVGVAALSGVCIAAVGLAAIAVWALPTSLAATIGLVVMGFFLGPLFPTTIASVPRLVPAGLVATAIGVLVATSITGGAVLPWLVGASAQRIGLWSLLPWAAASAAVLGLLWWRISRRLAAEVQV